MLTFLFILFVALLFVILNQTRNSQAPQQIGTDKAVVRSEQRRAVAKDYPILYIYVGVRVLILIVGSVVDALFIHSAAKVSSQFDVHYRAYQAKLAAQHLTPLPAHMLQIIFAVVIIYALLLVLGIWCYILFSKNSKVIQVILGVILVIEAATLLADIAKPSPRLILAVLQVALTSFVLWSLTTKKHYFAGLFSQK